MTAYPTVEFVDMTPEMAAAAIATQAPNRQVKKAKVQKFVRDMQAGRWVMTGEAIKFDDRGRMIDGQNRCHAVIASGATVRMMVIRGLQPEAQTVMDQGTPRSSRDALTFFGVANVKDVAAVVVIHSAWSRGELQHAMSHVPNPTRPTNAETVDYVQRNPIVEWAAVEGKRIYAHGLRLPVGAIGTALIETSAIDADASADFFERITTMRTNGIGDPVHTLLKRVQLLRDTTGIKLAPATGLFLIFRAWNAYRAGEPLLKFQLGSASTGWTAIPEPR